jgi:hypothetical protein
VDEAVDYISKILNEHAADDDLAKDAWKTICDKIYESSHSAPTGTCNSGETPRIFKE